jgi:NADPH-dependent curcumin reductase CurA
MVTSREIRLKSRPVGMPGAENFELATVTVPDPAPGEVQVKNIWMTVDPYMRGRMVDRASYVPPFQLGEPLQGGAIGEVVASDDPGSSVAISSRQCSGGGSRSTHRRQTCRSLRPLGCRPRPSWVLPACRV